MEEMYRMYRTNYGKRAASLPLQARQSGSFLLLFQEAKVGTSLVVQWLRLCLLNAGGPGSILGQGTRDATTKTYHSQINLKKEEAKEIAA